MSQLIRATVEFCVGQLPLFAKHSFRVGGQRNLCFEPFVKTFAVREFSFSMIHYLQRALLRWASNGQASQWAIGHGTNRIDKLK